MMAASMNIPLETDLPKKNTSRRKEGKEGFIHASD